MIMKLTTQSLTPWCEKNADQTSSVLRGQRLVDRSSPWLVGGQIEQGTRQVEEASKTKTSSCQCMGETQTEGQSRRGKLIINKVHNTIS